MKMTIQWLDPEPDWKNKYMANYDAIQKENDYHKSMWEGQVNRTKLAESNRDELHKTLCQISENLCGMKIGKPLEGIDEDETDISMVYAFVEGEIDKQAYLRDKAEAELTQLRKVCDELADRLKITDNHLLKLIGVTTAWHENKIALSSYFTHIKSKSTQSPK